MQVKRAKEIRYLAEAAGITKDIFAVISKSVKPGARESEIARELEALIKQRGLRRSFKTIVASGPNAAKPHAEITERIIKTNDVVVLDFGVIYKGYHSDMTRTMFVGNISPALRKLYKVVKAAQKMAIQKVRDGAKISSIVQGVHDYMRGKGLGKNILHSLGHGLGTRIHEAPKLSEKNKRKLKKNMVLAIEPGLYIRGIGGVRIEDMALVRKNGARVLTA